MLLNFAFKFNLRRHIKAYDFFGNLAIAESSGTFLLEIVINGATQQVAPFKFKVGRCRLTLSNPR